MTKKSRKQEAHEKRADTDSSRARSWIIKLASLCLGPPLFLYSLFILTIASCHDSGGFCAGPLVPGYYIWGVSQFLISVTLLSLFFTRSWKKIRTVLIISLAVIFLLIIVAEWHFIVAGLK